MMEATQSQEQTLLREKSPTEGRIGTGDVTERSTLSGPETPDTNRPGQVGEAPSVRAPSSTSHWSPSSSRFSHGSIM
jgi:hypothetical protein